MMRFNAFFVEQTISETLFLPSSLIELVVGNMAIFETVLRYIIYINCSVYSVNKCFRITILSFIIFDCLILIRNFSYKQKLPHLTDYSILNCTAYSNNYFSLSASDAFCSVFPPFHFPPPMFSCHFLEKSD